MKKAKPKIQDEICDKIDDFAANMKIEMIDNVHEKGDSWKTCHKSWLRSKLLEHFEAGNWVSVANYAFMLYEIIELAEVLEKKGEKP